MLPHESAFFFCERAVEYSVLERVPVSTQGIDISPDALISSVFGVHLTRVLVSRLREWSLTSLQRCRCCFSALPLMYPTFYSTTLHISDTRLARAVHNTRNESVFGCRPSRQSEALPAASTWVRSSVTAFSQSHRFSSPIGRNRDPREGNFPVRVSLSPRFSDFFRSPPSTLPPYSAPRKLRGKQRIERVTLSLSSVVDQPHQSPSRAKPRSHPRPRAAFFILCVLHTMADQVDPNAGGDAQAPSSSQWSEHNAPNGRKYY